MIPFVAESKIALNFTALDDTGSVVPLTGASANFAIVKSPSNTVKLVTKSTASGIEITDAAAGELTVTLDESDTEGFCGNYYCELKITDFNGDVSFFGNSEGYLLVLPFRDNIAN